MSSVATCGAAQRSLAGNILCRCFVCFVHSQASCAGSASRHYGGVLKTEKAGQGGARPRWRRAAGSKSGQAQDTTRQNWTELVRAEQGTAEMCRVGCGGAGQMRKICKQGKPGLSKVSLGEGSVYSRAGQGTFCSRAGPTKAYQHI